jgi:hypothetical protein
MNSKTHIAVDASGLICGLGASPEAAIAEAVAETGDSAGRWTTYPATPALVAAVEAHGGTVGWTWARGQRPRVADLEG